MTLRVLHVLDHSIPLQSGYAFRTLSILREQRALGWDTFHLTSPKHYATDETEETIDGWHFYRTSSSKSALASIPALGELKLMSDLAHRITEVAHRVEPDIMHVHSPVLNALPAIRVGQRLGIPVVYELRALWEDAAVDHGTTREGSLRYRVSRWLETFALRRAARITTICEGLRGEIVARGIPSERVTVVPNAVDIEAFRIGGRPDERLRESLGLDRGIVLGFAGSFYGYEGLDVLLEAFALLRPRFPELRVLLVGGGLQEEALKRQASRLGVAELVIFTGRVPHDTVQRYYELIDAFVYPRHSMRLTELVTPLKPLEAMAQGRIVVASNVGGHRELIRDRETGYLFEAGSAQKLSETIALALGERDKWPRMVAAGRKFVEEERNWRRSVQNYVGVYRSLLPNAPGLQPAA